MASNESTSVRDKKIVVTGAARGLGRAYATRLAAGGASVVLLDIDPAVEVTAESLRRGGAQALGVAADIGVRNQAREAIECGVKWLGSLDALVNNAGILRDDYLEEITEDDWALIANSHLSGSLWCTQAAVPHMQNGGSIVNTTSGAQDGSLGRSAYAAAKAGITAFTRSWALELAARRIRVNAVSPVAGTRMPGAKFDRFGQPAEDVGANNPAPDFVAPLICYLISDASNWVSGQVVTMVGRTIGLVSQQLHQARAVRPEGWTETAIAQQFEDGWRGRFGPIGALGTPYPWYNGVE